MINGRELSREIGWNCNKHPESNGEFLDENTFKEGGIWMMANTPNVHAF